MYALTMGGGTCMGTPDICNTYVGTASSPITYVNLSYGTLANAALCATVVNIEACPALMLESEITLSTGNESGTLGGIISGEFIGPTTFYSGSTTTFFEGGVALPMGTSITGQNGTITNITGSITSPSQTTVMTV